MEDIQIALAPPFKKSGATTITQRQSGDSLDLAGGGSLHLSGGNASGEGNIRLGAAASNSYDTNLLHLEANTMTGGALFGATPVALAANGPYYIGRGNTYSAIANQRGLFAIAAGNPSSPVAGEGEIQLLAGGDVIAARVDRNKMMSQHYGQRWGFTAVAAASYSVLVTDMIVAVTYTPTGAVTIDLPTAQLLAGRMVVIADTGGNASANNITVTTQGAELISGAATAVISNNYGAKMLFSDGTNWFNLGG